MTLDDLRKLLEDADAGAEYDHDAHSTVPAIALGLTDVQDMAAVPWMLTLTALGRDLLAALRAAATVADIERERDEALEALDAARSLDEPYPCEGCADQWQGPGPDSCADRCKRRSEYEHSPTYRLMDLRCQWEVARDELERERDEARAAARWLASNLARQLWRGDPSEEIIAGTADDKLREAYGRTGGTVPAETPAPSEPTDVQRVVLDILDLLRDRAHEVAAEDCPYVVERPDQSILAGLRDGWFQGRNRALSVMQGSIAGIRSAAEAAYTSTGGTVPEQPAQSEPSDDVPPECVKPDHELYECPGDGLCPYCDEYAAAMSDMAPAPDEPAQ